MCAHIYIYTDIYIYIYKFTSLHVKLLQSCLTLYNHVDYSPPGFSVHGILHAETLEWVAMPSSRGSSCPRDQTHISFWYLRPQRQFQKFSAPLADALGLVNGFPS